MSTTTEHRRCPECQAEIPADAPGGLCPKCLLQQVAAMGGALETPSSTVLESAAGAKALRERPAPPSVDEIAAAFPQLQILELIGRGGMGFVYKARQTKLDRFVALKILPGHLASEPSFHERFEREARILAKLQHPLIVSVFDFGEAVVPVAAETSRGRSYFYLMLEFVEGVNLREGMRSGRFTPEQALAIIPQVCEALQYAHSRGVLHRDIKPENILLDTDGRVKIADFGIAKVLSPDLDPASGVGPVPGSESEMAVTRLTATGSILGTPLYMAPEQLLSPNAVDHRADIYSLGVVFYEMLTGELPMGRFAPPSAKSPMDARIDEIVLRALAKERELRQQSAGEMKSEVETIASHPRQAGSPAKPDQTQASRSSAEASAIDPNASGAAGWWALAPLAIVPVVAVFLGWWHLIRQRIRHSRNGIIPAMIAAWLFPLVVLDVLIFTVVNLPVDHLRSSGSSRQFLLFAIQFIAAILCLLLDGALLVVTWQWVTRTPSTWFRQIVAEQSAATDGRRWWGLGLIGAAILFTIAWGTYVAAENRRITREWFNDITSVQHRWQTAQNQLNGLEGAWAHRVPSDLGKLSTDELRKFEKDQQQHQAVVQPLRAEVAELVGRMEVLSRAGNNRARLTSFLPVALFAIPLALTGLVLLLRRQRLVFSIGVAVATLVVLIVVVLMLLDHFEQPPPYRPSFEISTGQRAVTAENATSN